MDTTSGNALQRHAELSLVGNLLELATTLEYAAKMIKAPSSGMWMINWETVERAAAKIFLARARIAEGEFAQARQELDEVRW